MFRCVFASPAGAGQGRRSVQGLNWLGSEIRGGKASSNRSKALAAARDGVRAVKPGEDLGDDGVFYGRNDLQGATSLGALLDHRTIYPHNTQSMARCLQS
jgi:hypothetical protein